MLSTELNKTIWQKYVLTQAPIPLFTTEDMILLIKTTMVQTLTLLFIRQVSILKKFILVISICK